MTPHLGRLSQPRFLAYLRARTCYGAGLIVTPAGGPVYSASSYPPEVSHVPEGYQGDDDAVRPYPPDPVALRTWPATSAFLTQQAELVHSGGSLLVGQIHHPGAERSWDSFQPSLAPSALDGEWPPQHPHEMTDSEIDELIAAYVANAELIVAAGLDGVEVHAAHGYLLNRFLSPAYNRRQGRYGGGPEARWEILRAILQGIRYAVGLNPILGVRLPPFELDADGLSVDEVATGVASCRAWLSYINLSVGNHDGLAGGRPVLAYTTPWLDERPTLLPACVALKRAAGLPVVVTGGFVSAEGVEAALAGGADLVGVARAVIADPEFVAKLITGRGHEVVECIGCNECVLVPFACTVNPAAGREEELRRAPAMRRRKVVVIGGGPAGLSAGLAAAGRGHEIVVLERRDVLGGLLVELVRDPARRRWTAMLDRLCSRATEQLDVRLAHSFVLDDLTRLSADAAIVATGALPQPVSFALDGSVELLTSEEVLCGARPAGEGEVIVVGGTEAHLDPLLCARLLAAEGCQVIITSELVSLAPAVEQRTLNSLRHTLAVLDVRACTSTRLDGLVAGQATLRHLLSGATTIARPTTVVLAHSRCADASVAEQVRVAGIPTYVVGDALAPRRLTHAVLEGTRFGLSL
jgi:2,4-dienoyl-CoA reductase-like NADH-dependent reductase (Old Yellow Enzyme family)